MSGRETELETVRADTEKSPLKGVLIRGKGWPLPPKIEDLYKKEGYLLIGDGESFISKEDIKKLIEKAGGVDSRTRWDIIAHGLAVSGPDGRVFHMSTIFTEIDKTEEVLSLIKDVTKDNPAETHVWSCFAGAAAHGANILPPGSPLICHGATNLVSSVIASNKTVIEQIEKRQSLPQTNSNILDYKYILEDMPTGAAARCFVGISGVDETIRFHRKDGKRLLTTSEGVTSISQEFVNNIFSKITTIAPLDGITLPTMPPNITMTDHDIEKFQARRFWSYFVHPTKKFTHFLKTLLSTEEGKDYVIKQLKADIVGGHRLLTDIGLYEEREVSYQTLVEVLKTPTDQQKRSLLGLDDAKGTGLITFLMNYTPKFNEEVKSLFEFAAQSGKEALDKICENNLNGHNILSLAFLDNENPILEHIYKAIEHKEDPSVDAILNLDLIKKMLRNEEGEPAIFTILRSHLPPDQIIGSISLLNSTSFYLGEPSDIHFVIKDKDGKSALHAIAEKNDPELLNRFLGIFDIYRDIDEKNSILDRICEPDKLGKTPFLSILQNANTEMANILLEKLGPDRVRKMVETDRTHIEQLRRENTYAEEIIYDVEFQLRIHELNADPHIPAADLEAASALVRSISPHRHEATSPDSVKHLDLSTPMRPKTKEKSVLKRSLSSGAIISH